ncbi:MAG: hypothetical protein AABY26_04810 [Nanoarchaeota archaeon]
MSKNPLPEFSNRTVLLMLVMVILASLISIVIYSDAVRTVQMRQRSVSEPFPAESANTKALSSLSHSSQKTEVSST